MSPRVVVEEGEPLSGALFYYASQYSLDFEVRDISELHCRAGEQGVTSVVADTLQLEVAVETGTLLYAWG